MKKTYRIDLSTGIFRLIRKAEGLYVDKSIFIEHIINEPSRVLLFTRPRRMGKTTNLTMLQSFFDQSEDNDKLFDGLYIQKSPCYEKLAGYPVLFLDFKMLTSDRYKKDLCNDALKQLNHYVSAGDYTGDIQKHIAEKSTSSMIIKLVTENIYKVTGKNTIILIDEYDKLFMDSIEKTEFEDIRSFIKTTMLMSLKDNPYLEKAVITGVNRIAQESMFSDLNNLKVLDVFAKSDFDMDFGFSESEVNALIDKEDYEIARLYYNNCRIGNSKVFFTYSILSYLSNGELDNYWGQSGTMTRIAAATTDVRLEEIVKLMEGFSKGYALMQKVNPRLSVEDLKSFDEDDSYYSMLVQTGYLTFDYTNEKNMVNLFMPNMELIEVWQEFIIKRIDKGLNQARTIESVLRKDPPARRLAFDLETFLNNRISFMDISPYEPEHTYHMLVLGMMLGFGYSTQSNREAGEGRFDLLVTTRRQNLVFEFKSLEDKEDLEKGVTDALNQIKEKRYFADIENEMPTYLVGIAFCAKVCKAGVEKLI